jgi:hypothetical protein
MATKTLLSTPATGSAELFLNDDSVSLCLLVNRRHRHLRVIDFRAGPTVAKRGHILAAARREGVEKVLTLVERDEVATWRKLGFVREGSIPGFYRRSDASIMGIVVAEARPVAAATVLGHGDDEDEAADEVPVSAAALLAERTIAKARRLLRDDDELPTAKLAKVSDADARKAAAAAHRRGAALTGFEPFGRDAVRSTYACASRGLTLHLSAEAQPFFHNSFLELLTSPRNDGERLAATAALGALGERLRAEGVTSAFAIGPADEPLHASVFLANGFRRSAALTSHLLVDGERRHAIVWSKKLSQVD